MTDEQRETLERLNHGHFDPERFRTAFDLPTGYVAGWCHDKNDKPWLYVGVSPTGEASS